MSDSTEAYCPTCQEELTAAEYSHDTGCNECGCEGLWLSPDALVDQAEFLISQAESSEEAEALEAVRIFLEEAN